MLINHRDAPTNSVSLALSGDALTVLIVVRQETSPFEYEVDIWRRANLGSSFTFDRTVQQTATDDAISGFSLGNAGGLAICQDGSRYAMAGTKALYTFDDSRPSNGFQRFTRSDLGLSENFGGFSDCCISDDGSTIYVAVQGGRDATTETEVVRFVVLEAAVGQPYAVTHIEKSVSFDPLEGSHIACSGDASRLALGVDGASSTDTILIYA